MAFSSQLSLLPPPPAFPVDAGGVRVPVWHPQLKPLSRCAHAMLLLHAPMDTVGHPQLHTCAYRPRPSFHICTCLGVCTRVDWVLSKRASLLSPSCSSWRVPYSTDTSSAHSSVPPMWLMTIITVSMAMASLGQSAFILKQ